VGSFFSEEKNIMNIRKKFRARSIWAAALGIGMTAAARGSVILDSGNAWNGTSPTGTPPWLEAVVTNDGTDQVTLKLSAINLSDNSGNLEDVQDWFFNTDPALNLSDLTFAAGAKTGTFTTPTVNFTTHGGEKTQGDVPFDIDFSFATGNPSDRFTNGDSITFTVTYGGSGTFDENSFSFTSSKGSFGPFIDSAHIQNTGSNGQGSGDVADLAVATRLPEPAGLALLATTGVLMLRPSRSRKGRSAP
jgi:hypothetical protein